MVVGHLGTEDSLALIVVYELGKAVQDQTGTSRQSLLEKFSRSTEPVFCK
jgi:hypothetical protein